LLKIADELLSKLLPHLNLNRLKTIRKIKQQQWSYYFGKESKIPDRIVPLNKPYVRPIIRGKEIKPVEFGAKVNKVLVEGISFVEHVSFDA
jgi:IS5 family transposase